MDQADTNNPPINNNQSDIKLQLEEIQGLIVRGYNMKYVRHLIYEIKDAGSIKKTIGKLVSEDGADELHITSGGPWKTKMVGGKEVSIKPDFAINISFTYEGLVNLNLPDFSDESFESFHVFRQGAGKRAYFIGDTNDSGPSNWDPGFEASRNHFMLSIFAEEKNNLDSTSTKVEELFSDSAEKLNALDGANFPGGKIHFGYRDGISQPNVFGFPGKKLDGGQYPVAPWNFVLGDNDWPLDYHGNRIQPPDTIPKSPLVTKGAAPYKLPKPRVLGLNGSFAAFRVLKQDVYAFESFLESQKDTIDPELLAAKFCGRWRSGTPLALSPTEDKVIPDEQLNNFNYMRPKPTDPNVKDDPDTVNDLLGTRCPIGSHMRRNNGRNAPVSSTPTLHRIIRRGIPYGPQWDPSQGDDGIERGLLGLFICADLSSQFEFLMHDWVNNGDFAPDITGTKDPILGANDQKTSQFNLTKGPDTSQTIQIKGFPRFIKTKGSAYVFFPGISALRYISES